MKKPTVGIIIGSESDFSIIEKAIIKFKEIGVDFEVIVASAHRDPETVKEWAATAEERGMRVIIAAAGMSAHLPGVVASHTILPVIGVPIDASPLKGVDSLYSIVQMPSGIPVATVGINSAENAAILATEILAITSPELHLKMKQLRSNLKYKLKNQNISIKNKLAKYQKSGEEQFKMEIISTECAAKFVSKDEEEKRFSCRTSSEDPKVVNEIDLTRPKKSPTNSDICSIKYIDPVNPDPFELEEIADMLLDGKIIGIPTDTVYGVACDATSQMAIKKLYEIKQRSVEKAIPIMVHNLQMLKRIIPSINEKVKDMIDDMWPGALTIIFPKSSNILKYVSPFETIGVRIPNNYIILALISLLGRPLAVTSANISGETPLKNANDLQSVFGSSLSSIIDCGAIKDSPPSTVINVASEPYKIIREGAVARDLLKKYLGDLLE